MDKIYSKVKSSPTLCSIAEKTRIPAEYLAVAIPCVLLLAMFTTPLGKLLINIVCLFKPVQDALLLLKSPGLKIEDLKRTVIVLLAFVFFTVMESTGLTSLTPLYSFVKAGTMIWLTISPANPKAFYDIILAKIPVEKYVSSSDIKGAAKSAQNAVEDKVLADKLSYKKKDE
ncbi:receptor expression-enhancing protein 5/6 [Enteropsectra breve]|nr:receptor expression-enhancing protein 5/6 [Enteropsectra breve]